MLIGVPKEVKTHEYRVGLTPASVREVVAHGHHVVVETGAGVGVGFSDDDYRTAGAQIASTGHAVFAAADMVVKVKEPQAQEILNLRENQVLFTYLHLAPDPEQAKGLLKSGCTAIAYETVTDKLGGLPLLAPMSAVAGRMSIQAGARCLEKESGGAGILLGGVAGVPPAKVVVLGGGVAGTNAAQTAAGLMADVTILDSSMPRLRELDLHFSGKVKTLFSTTAAVERAVLEADLVIGAVLIPGAAAPKLVTRDLLRRMKKGSVVVDIAIDQGGCLETSRPTTHDNPTYIEEGVVHYCVANMPGAVARTSTFALNNATLPYVLALADKGWKKACGDDPYLRTGLNLHAGKVTHAAVAEALKLPLQRAEDALGL